MATTPGSKVNGVIGLEGPEFIVLSIGYRSKLIFPIEAGIKFMESYAQAIHIEEEYNKPMKIVRPQEIAVGFMSKLDLAKIQLDETIDPK